MNGEGQILDGILSGWHSPSFSKLWIDILYFFFGLWYYNEGAVWGKDINIEICEKRI